MLSDPYCACFHTWARTTDLQLVSPSLGYATDVTQDLAAEHIELSKALFESNNGRCYLLDTFTYSALNKSLEQCKAFVLLTSNELYLSAGSMLRLQIDAVLRFFAATLVENPHQFSLEVHRGNRISRQRDKLNNQMTDRYLCEQLGQYFKWLPPVYEKACGFVHLSDTHFAATLGVDTMSTSEYSYTDLGIRIGGPSPLFSESVLIEIADAFNATTRIFLKLVNDWLFAKSYPRLVALSLDKHTIAFASHYSALRTA